MISLLILTNPCAVDIPLKVAYTVVFATDITWSSTSKKSVRRTGGVLGSILARVTTLVSDCIPWL